MMKDEKPLLCRKDFKASARGNIKQEQEVNSSIEGEYVIGPRPWRMHARVSNRQKEEGQQLLEQHMAIQISPPPTYVCDMDDTGYVVGRSSHGYNWF